MEVKKFNIVSEGYDVNEVNKFLKIVTSEYEKIISKNKELEIVVKDLNDHVTELENKSDSVELFKEELDSYIENRREEKKSLEIELSILEKNIEEYKKTLNNIFYDHMELINKIK
ncbi:MAG: DivIVA domain-containing protein [Bacilli bacterium]